MPVRRAMVAAVRSLSGLARSLAGSGRRVAPPALSALVAASLVAAGACGDPAPASGGGVEVAEILGDGDTAGYARATEPRPLRFPDDHGPHPAYRTEWWYITGNLEADDGRRFGYQFTLFRTALAPEPAGRASPWDTNQAFLAHLALTDVEGGAFVTEERFARGALGLAGARSDPFRVWLEDWSVRAEGEGAFPVRLRAEVDGVGLDLRLARGKPPVLQGDGGLSRKGPAPGQASHYYSLTRMPTRGRLLDGGDTTDVRGLSWMDREWSTSSLGEGMVGWDWFALQLDDERELMYYRLRRADGTASPFSAGVLVEPDGTSRILASEEVSAEPLEEWESPARGRYPVAWRLEVPSEDLELSVRPVLPDQEWRETFRYWEGAVDVRGSRGGRDVQGWGYVELTGYAGEVPPAGR